MDEKIRYEDAVCAKCGHRSKLKEDITKIEAYCVKHSGTGVFIQIDELKKHRKKQ